MLKQSLVQEKLSDLTIATQMPSSNSNNGAGSASGQSSIQNVQADIVQVIKTSSNNKIKIKTIQNYPLSQSPTNLKYSNKSNENENDNDDNLDYDGMETVNFYSHNIRQRSNLNDNLQNNNTTNYNSKPANSQFNNNYQNHSNQLYNQNDKNIKLVKDSNQYDPNLKLKYLEKSIKFIQQQHNETLNSLHQEIEKLKNENRELHFKLATRKSSASTSNLSLKKEKSDLNQTKISTIFKEINTDQETLNKKIEQKNFDKALKIVLNENDIDKRLNDLKTNFENNTYEDLFTRLIDAENKNEYLTNIITQLQAKRSINSAYRPNVNVNNSTTITNLKININHIYSVDPLKIKLTDQEEPRAPSIEESEIIIKKLFEIYKQQKQQISNMKVVLRDLMHNENLSNQGMLMARDLLDHPSKFTHYILDHSGLNKLSMLAPLTNYNAPKSSNSRLNYSHKYHSQILTTNGIGYESAGTVNTTNSSNQNVSTVHLPPLQNINPAKFPERQRRTQLLQKQRLRKEYFH